MADSLTLTVDPRSLSVRALTLAPGVAVATGKATLSLGGKVIGRAALHNGVAPLRYTVRDGQARLVTTR